MSAPVSANEITPEFVSRTVIRHNIVSSPALLIDPSNNTFTLTI
jgi:hypothetical protein